MKMTKKEIVKEIVNIYKYTRENDKKKFDEYYFAFKMGTIEAKIGILLEKILGEGRNVSL